MHPPLTVHKHTDCIGEIVALNNCHIEHPVMKFFTTCNDFKAKVDQCLNGEYEKRRRDNYEKAKEKSP
ncbi:hypothetical protein DSO57_1020937 [Entomophthora muscae]|uniref:Uncharacterized protein n=1 Tax=Entomophthora muscae TaxID=34485 RepID=A0ACC2U1P2_9FUNG|nr:hypothetical protein DSO57_1020937 [Entomophthora muscae]